MKNRLFYILGSLYVLAAGCSTASSATLSYLKDLGDTTHDTATGLEWLDLSLTTGQSYQSIAAGWNGYTTTQGYRFATRSEVVQLFLDAGVAKEAINAGWTFSSTDAAAHLFSLLGTGSTLTETTMSWMYYDSATEPVLPGPAYAACAVFSIWNSPAGDQAAFLTPGIIPLQAGNEPEMASGLVRVASIPEPSIWFLFTAGLGAVLLPAGRRRRSW